MKALQDYPLYTIGVVSELLGVHPETIRVWERHGVVQPPQRRSGKRFYSEKDFKRLQFTRKLVREGLSMRAILYYLRLYPCWKTADCSSCIHNSDQISSPKLCWQEDGTYCQVANIEDRAQIVTLAPGKSGMKRKRRTRYRNLSASLSRIKIQPALRNKPGTIDDTLTLSSLISVRKRDASDDVFRCSHQSVTLSFPSRILLGGNDSYFNRGV